MIDPLSNVRHVLVERVERRFDEISLARLILFAI